MHILSFIVGIVGNITSALVFASPIKTFWRVVRSGSTEEFDSLPYVCALLSSSLWAYYGVLNPNGLLILTVNSVGAALELTYVVLFITYAPKRAKIKTLIWALILDVVFLGGAVSVTSLVLHESVRLTVIGFMCVGLTLFFYGSPLAVMVSSGILFSFTFDWFGTGNMRFISGNGSDGDPCLCKARDLMNV